MKKGKIDTSIKRYYNSETNKLLICFGGLNHSLMMPVFEFFNILNSLKLNIKILWVMDLDQCWYQKGIRGISSDIESSVVFLKQEVIKTKCKKVITLGTSAGGFAAILFGNLLFADKIITFAPQTFIDLEKDNRWPNNVKKALRFQNEANSKFYDLKNIEKSSPLKIWVGKQNDLDVTHAQNVKSINTDIIYLDTKGHKIARNLKQQGLLHKVLKEEIGNC